MGGDLAVEKLPFASVRGKEERPRRRMPSVRVCGILYATKHAIRYLSIPVRKQKETINMSQTISIPVMYRL